MNIKRAFFLLATALLMPGLAMAGVTAGFVKFEVDLDFIPDDLVATTTVKINCSNVIDVNVKEASQLHDGQGADFVFESLDLSVAECHVEVTGAGGYEVSYLAGVVGGGFRFSDNDDGCDFALLHNGGSNPISLLGANVYTCVVTFTLDAPKFTLIKDWSPLADFDENISYTLEIACDTGDGGGIIGPITGGSGGVGNSNSCAKFGPDSEVLNCDFVEWGFTGIDDESVSVSVRPPTQCIGFEFGVASSAIVSSGCSSYIDVDVDEDESCTITNTVFFEGIPTLNQYGLAIMALLMLGIGFVGFRRFV